MAANLQTTFSNAFSSLKMFELLLNFIEDFTKHPIENQSVAAMIQVMAFMAKHRTGAWTNDNPDER